jgi:predicted membrane protein
MSWRVILGVGLLVIGGGFLLDRMGVVDFGPILASYWPMILVLIGVIQLATRSVPALAGVLVVGLGALLQIDQLEVVDFDLGQLIWPLVLIAAGGFLLLNRSRRSPVTESDNRVDSFVMFGGLDRRVDSQAFEGGSAMALFGGTEIDLRDAKLSPKGADLDLTAAFGGIELTVPETWKVRVTGMPIFGGWSNKARLREEAPADLPVLNVRCFVAFGGVEVHN